MFDIILAGFMFFNVMCSATMLFMAFMFIDHPVAGLFWLGYRNALFNRWVQIIGWGSSAAVLYALWHYEMLWSLLVFLTSTVCAAIGNALYFINRKQINEAIDNATIIR